MARPAHNNILVKSLPYQDTAASSILKTLAYFDIFHYPLTVTEIKQFLGIITNEYSIEKALEQLVIEERVFIYHQFYSLHNNPLLACKRVQGNRHADRLLPIAHRIGRFLYQFPFVRAVGISGSLSKHFADEKADIDFFIITKANRLWVARTLMHVFKKLTFLFGRQHYYCMNYYVDEQSLTLDEKNIFTAIELKTLIPVSGTVSVHQFFLANQWANKWLPVCAFREQSAKDPSRSLFKRISEWLLDGHFGNRLDDYFMRITERRWKKKEMKGLLNKKGIRMGLRTGKHFARSNPGAFQEKVLSSYRERLCKLELSDFEC